MVSGVLLYRDWRRIYIAVIGPILCDVTEDSIVCNEIFNLANGWGAGIDAFRVIAMLDILVHCCQCIGW